MILREEWTNLVSKYSEDQNQIDKYWSEIERQYTGKSRYYHNLKHIEDILEQCRLNEDSINDIDALKFAIWYHDIKYDITRKDNEEKSAELAKIRMSEIGINLESLQKCKELILATKSHDLNTFTYDEDFKWLLDFDLSILGREPAKYEIYRQQIRKEYWIYPTILYNRGRKKVLKKFLESGEIFKTSIYQERFEHQARINMRRELDQL